jgi:phosphoglycolate phosphatase
MPFRFIIFDLDGTLIDSQKSILSAIQGALIDLGLDIEIPITKDLIGPPLMTTLEKITSISDPEVLNKIADKFRYQYDSCGYKESTVYPGIHNLLNTLWQQGYALYIATNKRIVPTKKIVDYIAWNHLFSAIYSIDSRYEEQFKSKGEMILALLDNERIDPASTLYVGDRIEDYEAAKFSNLQCVLVDWGYGLLQTQVNRGYRQVRNSMELLNMIQGLN